MKREEYITAVRKGGLIDLENGVHRSGKPITSAVCRKMAAGADTKSRRSDHIVEQN